MKPIATALRRLADWLDPKGAPLFHIPRSGLYQVTLTGRRARGIPVADRGDALDFEWDDEDALYDDFMSGWTEPHGEDYR